MQSATAEKKDAQEKASEYQKNAERLRKDRTELENEIAKLKESIERERAVQESAKILLG